ncbi:MAG: phytanoyl-CoA dioxygenase family protein [Opitutales bacterium]
MQLTPDQKRQFVEQGFLRLPGVIPPERVEAARKLVNHHLGQGFDAEQRAIFAAQSYFPELREHPDIKGLMEETPAYGLAEQLTAPGELLPVWRGQMALRFPMLEPSTKVLGGHIDGTPSPTNGVPPGTIYSFTMLAGVALSDVRREDAGNFTVWPGSHLKLQEWFQTHDLMDLLDGAPRLDYGPPHQVQWEAGDLMLAHYQLLHGIAPNYSGDIRYAVFFRLHHVEHKGNEAACVRDIWREWKGLAAYAQDLVTGA